MTNLEILIRNPNSKECKEWIASTANVNFNQIDVYGNTPLHYCAKFGHYGLMKSLLPKSLTDIQNNSGDTALHFAVKYGNENSCSLVF